jgi:hypothetical protein
MQVVEQVDTVTGTPNCRNMRIFLSPLFPEEKRFIEPAYSKLEQVADDILRVLKHI